MHYARKGIITEEMLYVASRERLAPELELPERARELEWMLTTGIPDSVLDDQSTAPAWFAGERADTQRPRRVSGLAPEAPLRITGTASSAGCRISLYSPSMQGSLYRS